LPKYIFTNYRKYFFILVFLICLITLTGCQNSTNTTTESTDNTASAGATVGSTISDIAGDTNSLKNCQDNAIQTYWSCCRNCPDPSTGTTGNVSNCNTNANCVSTCWTNYTQTYSLCSSTATPNAATSAAATATTNTFNIDSCKQDCNTAYQQDADAINEIQKCYKNCEAGISLYSTTTPTANNTSGSNTNGSNTSASTTGGTNANTSGTNSDTINTSNTDNTASNNDSALMQQLSTMSESQSERLTTCSTTVKDNYLGWLKDIPFMGDIVAKAICAMAEMIIQVIIFVGKIITGFPL